MYLSLAFSLNIHEGMFYWYTDAKAGPSFSQVHRRFALFLMSDNSLLLRILFRLRQSTTSLVIKSIQLHTDH